MDCTPAEVGVCRQSHRDADGFHSIFLYRLGGWSGTLHAPNLTDQLKEALQPHITFIFLSKEDVGCFDIVRQFRQCHHRAGTTAGPSSSPTTCPAVHCILCADGKCKGRVRHVALISGRRRWVASFLCLLAVKVVLTTPPVAPEVSADAELLDNEPGSAPSYRCVLESKGAYLPARRSREIADPDRWDLSVVGLRKRQRETEQVKKLKHVIIQFDTRDSKCKTSPKPRWSQNLVLTENLLGRPLAVHNQVQAGPRPRQAQNVEVSSGRWAALTGRGIT